MSNDLHHIAHQFNNLLTIIGGNVDLLQGSLPEGSISREQANAILVAVEKASLLTHQLHVMARTNTPTAFAITTRNLQDPHATQLHQQSKELKGLRADLRKALDS